MTLRERMLSVYRGQMPDRPAVGIYTRYLPRGGVERAARNLGLGVIAYMPLCTQMGPPWHMLPGFLSEVRDASLASHYRWENSHLVERRIYETQAGSVWAEIGQSVGAGSEHISSFYIKSIEDYATMKRLVENTVMSSNTALFEDTVRAIGSDGVVMGRMDRTPYQKLLLELAGAERFLTDLYDEPEPVEELMDALARRYREQVDRAMDSSAELIWIPDNVTVDMTPPAFYEKYLLELYRYCVTCAHQVGKTVVAHYDGKVAPLVPLIRQTGVDVIESVSQPSIGGDLTYAQWLENFPDKVILPNFPSNLCNASDAEIERCVSGYLEAAQGRPFMLQISEDLADGTWDRVIPLVTEAMAQA